VSEFSGAVSALTEQGFENWQGRALARYLPLHDELLGAPDLERGVIDFARESFARIVRSGVLALEPEAQPMGETDEG
jgi:hypothetical protein